ncbi:hypothetical protein QYF36_010192 [Acer negundo]|nr:hypothetical protein QYF36_010192 [Acer negundo]
MTRLSWAAALWRHFNSGNYCRPTAAVRREGRSTAEFSIALVSRSAETMDQQRKLQRKVWFGLRLKMMSVWREVEDEDESRSVVRRIMGCI